MITYAKQRVLLVVGTRPELIRLSLIIKKLDEACELKIYHTGQNYDPNLNDIFYTDLGIRKPDYQNDTRNLSTIDQICSIFKGMENALNASKAEKVLILGDTNSSLSAFVAERMGIPVYHMEAGNRCFDKKVPEEINRRFIDAVSTFNIPYSMSSRENLLRDGQHRGKLYVSGNPLWEVINFYKEKIDSSNILNTLMLEKDKYIVVTAHRSENVDLGYRLTHIFDALEIIAKKYNLPVIFSCHPRTKAKLEKFDVYSKNPLIKLHDPFNFTDFIKLQQNCKVLVSDSGSAAEEGTLLFIPTVIIRDSTERPESVDAGATIISGTDTRNIVDCFDIMYSSNRKWKRPDDYLVENVSDRVVQFVLAKNPIYY